jgi:anti-anti-sigma factor
VPDLADLTIERESDGLVCAVLSGELELANVRPIRARLYAALENADEALLVDLSGVAFLDSSAVEMLFRLREDLRIRQQRLAVVVADDAPVRRAVAVSDPDDRLAVVPTRAAAREALGAA